MSYMLWSLCLKYQNLCVNNWEKTVLAFSLSIMVMFSHWTWLYDSAAHVFCFSSCTTRFVIWVAMQGDSDPITHDTMLITPEGQYVVERACVRLRLYKCPVDFLHHNGKATESQSFAQTCYNDVWHPCSSQTRHTCLETMHLMTNMVIRLSSSVLKPHSRLIM